MYIDISIAQQTLWLRESENGPVITSYRVSTASNGMGCEKNSGCTPIGPHIIRAKIGDGVPANTVFVGRRPTGELCSPELMAQYPNRDWILTRILWLSGTALGLNRLGNVDTMQRYIYIHGSPDSAEMGQPGSHGCVRMRNQDIIDLFSRVSARTPVMIRED